MEAKKLAYLIQQAAENKKAQDMVILDMRKASNLCDYFFICTSSSSRQSKAIADGIIEDLKKKGLKPWHKEGYQEGRWVVLDCNSVVAHIFLSESRSLYKLERLWGDTPRIDFSKRSKKPKKRTRCKRSSSKKASPA